MFPSSNDCHLCILPSKEKDCIKLIRYNNQIYKFTIKSSDILQKFLIEHGVIRVQMELQDIILQVLSMRTKNSGKTKMHASLFSVIITLSEAIESKIVAESEESCHTALKTGHNNISVKRTLSAENHWKHTFQKSENEAADIMNNTRNTVEEGGNLNQMEKERLKKLSEATIPDVPKKQNRKNKRHKGILNYFFRFLYKDTD